MLKGFGDTLEGVLLPGYVTSDYSLEFVDAYKEKYNQSPDMYAAIGHDMVVTLVESLKAGATKNELISKLIVDRPKGVSLREFHFNQDRTISLPLEVLEIGKQSMRPVKLE